MDYRPIENLAASEVEALRDTEISALAEVIAEYRQWLTPDALERFNKRVAREWAIETGMIEGLYRWDRGVTETMIEHGLTESRIPPNSSDMSPQQVAAILRDHLDTLEGLFAFVKGDRRLSKSYIHELHQALLRSQDSHVGFDLVTRKLFRKELVKGEYKRLPNNPTREDGSVHPYSPPEHVEAEMDRLIAIAAEQEEAGWPMEIRAAWLHHAFTRIHPYPDGNGRVARALATLILIRAGLMPLVVPSDEKASFYIPALERADAGDFAPLIDLVRNWQGRQVVELSNALCNGPLFLDTKTAFA